MRNQLANCQYYTQQIISVLFLTFGFIIINYTNGFEFFGMDFRYVLVFCMLQVCFTMQKLLLLYVDTKTAFDTLDAVQQLKMVSFLVSISVTDIS